MNDPLTLPVSDRCSAVTALDHLALLVVRGADARTFLDSQLTRNVPAAAAADAVDVATAASLAGYCSPKGRLLATLVAWSDADAMWLVLSRDIAPAIAKRLRMYVLRAKVTVDETASMRLEGVVDPVDAPEAVGALQPWSAARVDGRWWVRYPDADGHRRFLLVTSAERIDEAEPHAWNDDTVDGDFWRWLDLRAGLPAIGVATQDRFVPQMLNLEALGAVDFKKGCFPGQEIVARSQYLGKLKRRTTLASLASEVPVPAPGTDVWQPGGHEPAGLVVDAARGPDGAVALLVELPLASFAATDLRVGAIDGPTLALEPLPYPLPDNEVFVRPRL